MKKKIHFLYVFYFLLFISCKSDEENIKLSLVGDWYACQYWGEEKREETDVYESESGTIRILNIQRKLKPSIGITAIIMGRILYPLKKISPCLSALKILNLKNM